MGGDPRDPDFEAAEAELQDPKPEDAATPAKIAAQRDGNRGPPPAVAHRLSETQAGRVLEVSGIVFGLTVAFVAPDRTISFGELVFLGIAIVSLGGSILVSLIVVLDAPQSVVKLQSGELLATSSKARLQARRQEQLAGVGLSLCSCGIFTLIIFAVLRLPSPS
jgi:hypothetical protein